MSLKNKLMHEVHADTPMKATSKVSIVGAGQVGMSCAISVLQQHLSDELVLVDRVADKLKGEALDLLHGSLFLKSKISADTDFLVTEDSKVCIICTGVRQAVGEVKRRQLQKNIATFKEIIPQLVKHSPSAVLLVVTTPVDAMTYVAWRLSGFPKHRVIGMGTDLDTARFRFLLGAKLKINPISVHAYIIGEQGDESVAVWSSANVAGVNLEQLDEKLANEQGDQIHRKVIESAHDVIKLKGYTSWAIGLSVASIVNAILKNIRSIHLVSVNAKDEHNITSDVFLSLPCVLGITGVCGILKQPLKEKEELKLKNSVENLLRVQREISL
ncbi:L-lactate dehydrogenase A chain-like [Carcharodon carcharias]|uniref:L-lactate dehydrogenase A chain-like n=1 Tax=Carcharodon carcharias TaxID=13397 RepID=UPI001B7E292E|nr:L-lactate dehydrogenase A chain-like [Carcharodon carcharias]